MLSPILLHSNDGQRVALIKAVMGPGSWYTKMNPGVAPMLSLSFVKLL